MFQDAEDAVDNTRYSFCSPIRLHWHRFNIKQMLKTSSTKFKPTVGDHICLTSSYRKGTTGKKERRGVESSLPTAQVWKKFAPWLNLRGYFGSHTKCSLWAQLPLGSCHFGCCKTRTAQFDIREDPLHTQSNRINTDSIFFHLRMILNAMDKSS